MNQMLLLILLLCLTESCGADSKQINNPVANSQTSQQSSKPEKEGCDFSSHKPFVMGGLKQAPILSGPPLNYPPEAKERKLEGDVTVKLLINVHSGLVEQVCVIEGDEILGKAAQESALQMKFSPDWDNNKYLAERYNYFEANMTYHFKL